jgi:hypothetical protein
MQGNRFQATDNIQEALIERLQELVNETNEVVSALRNLHILNRPAEVQEYDNDNDEAIEPGPSDREGNPLQVGQVVKILTRATFNGNTTATITKVGKAKVTLKVTLLNKRKETITTRNFNNVLVIGTSD